MPNATVERNITIAGLETKVTKVYTDTAQVTIDEAVAIDAADDIIALTLVVTQIKVWMMTCDQALRVDTNTAAPGADTFTLTANVPLLWTDDDGTTNPLATDITKLYVTNTSGSVANFKFRALYDSTV